MAYIRPSLSINPATVESPRGIITTEDVDTDEVHHAASMLQFGIEHARDECGELLHGLPESLWNARLGLALCFEKRRAALSPFAPH